MLRKDTRMSSRTGGRSVFEALDLASLGDAVRVGTRQKEGPRVAALRDCIDDKCAACYQRQLDGRYFGATVDLVHDHAIEPSLVIGDSTNVLALMASLASFPNVAVIRPLPSVEVVTLTTYLPLVDVAVAGRPADAGLPGKWPLLE